MARQRVIAALTATIALLLAGVLVARADTPDGRDSMSHRLTLELRPAYNIPSHFYMRGYNPDSRPLNKSLSAHINYTFSFSPHSHFGKAYPTAYQGIGIATYTFFAHESIGMPMLVYLLQGARIAKLAPALSLNYEWNVGFSWGWRPNSAMNSKYNIMVGVALPIVWRVAPRWQLSLTPEFTHFSNGDTSFSNSGANLFGLRVGASYLFSSHDEDAPAHRYIAPSKEYADKSFIKHITWDILGYGGWRSDRFTDSDGHFHCIEKPLPLGGIRLMPMYHLNDYFAIGTSLDIHIDGSANLYDGVHDEYYNTIAYSRPPLYEQTAVGVSLCGEISAPIFTVGIGAGFNLIKHGYDMRTYYTTFSLKAFLTKRLFLYLGYRFNSMQYTHSLMYGLGIRI